MTPAGHTPLIPDQRIADRVYHAHRLGSQRRFDEAKPPALIEQRVRKERHKEAALERVYGMTITPAIVAAEVQRILRSQSPIVASPRGAQPCLARRGQTLF